MEDDAIRITHFINPHMFWYKPEAAYVHNLEEKRYQLKIDEYCEQHFRRANSDRYYDGYPGEVVAVLDFDRNKWCRCVLDEISEDRNGEKRYHLWAIDDGVPIQSSTRYINPLPDHLISEATSKVKRGSIKNVLPSECVYDPNEDKVVAKVTNRWDRNAVAMLHSIIQNGSEIYFRNVTKHKVCNELTYFGDLEIVTRGSRRFDADRVLTESRRAHTVDPRDFIAKLSEIQTMSENRHRSQQVTENGKSGQAIKPTTPGRPYQQDRPEHTRHRNESTTNYEINGVNEEDFEESASMIRPNLTGRPQIPQQYNQQAIPENSNSEEDLYPVAPERSNGLARGNELALFCQKTRPPNPESLTDPRICKPRVGPPKTNEPSPSNRSNMNATIDNSPDPPKSTVSFASKLAMRQKLKSKVAKEQQQQQQQQQEQQSPPKSKNDAPLNLIPAGFNMGNISFENGRAVAGNSSDSSERKSKQPSPGFKLRQKTASAPIPSFDKLNGNAPVVATTTQGSKTTPSRDDGRESSDFSGGGKVYMTKNTSRFDKYVEEEAW